MFQITYPKRWLKLTKESPQLKKINLKIFDEKPEGWKPSGTRVKRGLYHCATGIELNADINGAIGIVRKVAEQYGFEFDARGFEPKRFDNA